MTAAVDVLVADFVPLAWAPPQPRNDPLPNEVALELCVGG